MYITAFILHLCAMEYLQQFKNNEISMYGETLSLIQRKTAEASRPSVHDSLKAPLLPTRWYSEFYDNHCIICFVVSLSRQKSINKAFLFFWLCLCFLCENFFSYSAFRVHVFTHLILLYILIHFVLRVAHIFKFVAITLCRWLVFFL